MKLVFDGVSAGYTEVPAVHDVTLTIAQGEFVAVVGPNGSGKSTLLKTVYRALRPRAGAVLLGDEDVWTARHRDVARRVGVLGQDQAGGYDFTAREAVRLGRYPHLGAFDRLTAADEAVVADALERAGATVFADRPLSTLSGSACCWPGPWPSNRRCLCWTSRPTTSTRRTRSPR
ncbi:ABC transporter ATP-binding protein [Saccharopolyspora sp. NPDC002376]